MSPLAERLADVREQLAHVEGLMGSIEGPATHPAGLELDKTVGSVS